MWLEKAYLEDKLSLKLIGKSVGVPHSIVRSALATFGIARRTKSEGQRVRYAAQGVEDYFTLDRCIINGSLLGDAGLKITNPKGVDCYPVFVKKNLHRAHTFFVASQLFSKDPDERIAPRPNTGCRGHTSDGLIYELSTLSHKELLPFYRDWYPAANNFKKVIPASLVITPKLLLHWFLDDGYSYYFSRPKCKVKSAVRIQFATQSFTRTDLDALCAKILALNHAFAAVLLCTHS